MRIAIVHDYIKEYGGAERVLEELVKLFPNAPIYTAFYKKGSPAYDKFQTKKIIPSWAHYFFCNKTSQSFEILGAFNLGKF